MVLQSIDSEELNTITAHMYLGVFVTNSKTMFIFTFDFTIIHSFLRMYQIIALWSFANFPRD